MNLLEKGLIIYIFFIVPMMIEFYQASLQLKVNLETQFVKPSIQTFWKDFLDSYYGEMPNQKMKLDKTWKKWKGVRKINPV